MTKICSLVILALSLVMAACQPVTVIILTQTPFQYTPTPIIMPSATAPAPSPQPQPSITAFIPSPTSPAPAILADAVLIVPFYATKSGYLLTAVQNTAWLEAKSAAQNLSDNLNYRLYKGTKMTGTAKGGAVTAPEPQDVCQRFWVTLEPNATPGTIAVSGAWNAQPRPVAEIPANNEIYRQVVADFLKGRGLTASNVQVQSILTADLDGNGTAEVLVQAEYFKETSGHDLTAGDYSVLLLRSVGGNQAITAPLLAELYPTGRTLAFPYRQNPPIILDLNGDGRMEIVAALSGWERDGVLAFEFRTGTAEKLYDLRCAE